MKVTSRHFALPALLALGACTVGPNYDGPPQIASTGENGANGFVRADGSTQTQAPALAQWWTVFSDPVLDSLEQRALVGSPDLAAARARLDQARAALKLERANDKPEISAMGVAAHVRIPDLGNSNDASGGEAQDDSSDATTASLYNLGLQASWEIDLFGGQRRGNEAARAELAGAEAGVADAQVSLTAAIAQAYFDYRDRQQRLQIAQQAVERNQRLVQFAQQHFDLGAGTQTDIEQAQTALEDSRQQVAPLQAEADSLADALAILTGDLPGSVDAELSAPADIPLPPANIAIGDPQSLIERRPDIRVAERRLAAETARIGVAEAARFPHLNFLGILGVGGSSPSDLTHLDDFTAIAAPILQWSFLDFGRGAAQVGQAKGKRDEAEARYRGAVLDAMRDVEDALANFRAARELVASRARAEQSAAKMERLEQQRVDLGADAQPLLIEAELQHNRAQSALTQARAQLATSFVALQKALGLGWTDS